MQPPDKTKKIQTGPSTTIIQWCDELQLNRLHALIFTLAGMVLIFDGYDSQIIAYIMPHLMKEWNLTPVTAGSIASYGFLGLMIGAAGFGMIADKIGRKGGLLICLAIFTIFSGAAYWAPNFKIFCILRFLAGLGMGGAMPLAITLVSEFAPARIRAKAVTAMFGGFTFGWAVAGLIAMLIIPTYGWRLPLLFGFLPILFLPVLVFYLPESIRFLVSKGKIESAVKEIRRMENAAGLDHQEWGTADFALPATPPAGGFKELFSPRLAVMTILIWATYFCNLLVVYGLATWLPSLLVKSGFSMVKSYSFGFVQALGASAGGFLLGFLMDRFGRKSGLIVAYLAGGVAIWMFGIVTGNISLYLVGAATGVFVIGSQIAQHVVSGEVYPTHIRSTGVGWALTVGRLGSIVGPLLGGYMQMWGLTFSQYFVVFAIPSFLCAALVIMYQVNVKQEGLEIIHEKLMGDKS